MALTWTGRKHRPESIAKMSAANRGRLHTQAYKDFMRATMTGRTIHWIDKVSRSLCKLTAEQVADVHRLIASGVTQTAIATRFHVDKGTISNIHRGKGYRWLKSEALDVS